MKEELELFSAEKDHLQEVGEELVGLIGEPDKPEVDRGLEDMDAAFRALDDACDMRQQTLDDALRRAVCFHDELNVSICLFVILPATVDDEDVILITTTMNLAYLALRSSGPWQNNGQQGFTICSCL